MPGKYTPAKSEACINTPTNVAKASLTVNDSSTARLLLAAELKELKEQKQ